MNQQFAEQLEPRRLLAGVTLLCPAYNGGLTNWLDTEIGAITSQLGGPQNVPQYVLTIAPNSNGTLAVQGVTHVAGTATPQSNNPGQIVVTVDYDSVSTNPDYPLIQTGTLVANYMETTPVDGVLWADLPITEISTSRGTGLTDSIAQVLDESDVWVNQETYLDPHPDTSGPFLDPLNAIYDNVEFSDDYWRSSGEDTDTDPGGHPVSGAYNLNLTWVQADYDTFGLAHLAPPAWYIGTTDPALIGTYEGQGNILSAWYQNGNPSPTSTGFLYTLIGGGTRPTSGLWAASGGTGVRTSVTHSGLQWPNISDVASTDTTISTSATLPINFIHDDQSEADTITFYLDSDQNPYDGKGTQIGSQTGVAASSSTSSGTYNANLTGVATGSYWIAAAVTDSSGLVRYDYSEKQINITSPSVGGGSLTGVQSTPASAYNLTTLGTSDWAHWGTAGNNGVFDHKSSGNSQISNVTQIGSGSYGGYFDPTRDVSWTDGTPQATDSGDDGYIWANNVIGAGYSFTAPASTGRQTLYVYLGGYSSGGKLTATLSDNSASPDTFTFTGTALYTDVVAFTYGAASSNQTLTISYTKNQAIGGAGGSVDLIAAWLAGSAVTTPTPTGGGSIAGAQSTPASAYNLTALGTSDWAHWGTGGNGGVFDHKSAGESQISNVTKLGSGNYGGYFDPTRDVSWIDGTPLATDSGDDGYIWANNAIGAGYSFTAPASTTSKALYVYLGGYSSGGQLTATLSDGSASPYTLTFSGAALYTDLVAITYSAASANQTITINYTKSQTVGGAGGSVDLIAAWLGGTPLATTGGSMTGVQSTPTSAYNLTSSGSSDWAHWGTGGNASAFDHKSTGNSQVSNVSTLGSGANYGAYDDVSRNVSWTGGTPLASDGDDDWYIWANNANGAGYAFTAPADTTTRTLYVYVGGYSSSSTLTATLSDSSASPYTVSFSGTGLYSDIVAITYNAASANQKITISYLKSQAINGAGGSSDLIAAWLA